MKSLKTPATTAASALLLVFAAGVSAQTVPTTKKVILKNVDPAQGVGPEGKETVGGVERAALPIQGQVTLDESGNLLVECTSSSDCPNIGAGTAAVQAPSLDFGVLADPVPDNPTPPAVLTWTSSGATCYGKQALRDGTVYQAVSWEKNWAPITTNTTGFPLAALPRSTTGVTEYKLTLECRSTPNDLEAEGASVIAIQEKTATIRLAKSSETNSCATYLATLPQSERDRYYAYLPENRGFQRLEETLSAYAGGALGDYNGKVTGGIPKGLENNQYRALSFSLADGKQATMEMKKETFGVPGIHSELTYSVSPCPGDFRPRDLDSSDMFLSSASCRTDGLVYSFNARVRTPSTATPGYCNLEAGRTYYFNVSRQNTMLDPGPNPQAPVPVPDVTCGGAWTQCGQSMTFKNI